MAMPWESGSGSQGRTTVSASMNAVSLAPASAFPTTTRYRAEESSQLRSVVDQPDVHAGGDRHGRDAPP